MRYIKISIYLPLDDQDTSPKHMDYLRAKDVITHFVDSGKTELLLRNPDYEIIVNPSREREPY